MGAYSYTLYIIHFPIMMLIAAQVGRGALVATGGVLVAWLLSAWVGPIIERPKEQKKAVLALVHGIRRRRHLEAADASPTSAFKVPTSQDS
jgi:peptidoglycan/LPS O-acetylase OafA/YrhL